MILTKLKKIIAVPMPAVIFLIAIVALKLKENFELRSKGRSVKVSNIIAKKVRVFCWIYTHEANHDLRAIHVRATWAQHCTKYLFFSSKNDTALPAIDVGVPPGREHLWLKTRRIMTYIYEHFLNDFDWILRADDDAYVIVENLRLMLLPYSPDELIYFGHKLRNPVTANAIFPQGGVGYVISKRAVKLVVERGFNDSTKCRIDDGELDDRFLGICMANLGVKFGDSRDAQGRHRFFGGNIVQLLWPGTPFDPAASEIQNLSFYPMAQGIECCSDYAISIHYTDARTLYLLEYIIYHVEAFGARKLITEKEVYDYYEKAKLLAEKNVGPDDSLAKLDLMTI